jgi:aconitate hydratase 2/2-methylisocitrate dehydratase
MKGSARRTRVIVGDIVASSSPSPPAIRSGASATTSCPIEAGGVVIDSLAAHLLNAAEDSGGLPLMADVTKMKTGDIITLDFSAGAILDAEGRKISGLVVKPATLKDEFRAGGRLALIIGRQLTARARKTLGLGEADFFTTVVNPVPKPGQGYTLAQKIVGRAARRRGAPGTA